MITEYSHYLDPNIVYIPITDEDFTVADVVVNNGDMVKIGQVIAYKFKGTLKLSVLSSVSGVVKDIAHKMSRFGRKVDHLVIENDRQYKIVDFKHYKYDVTAQEIRQAIEGAGLYRVDVDGLFTSLNFEKPMKHLVVSTVFVNEPFISTNEQYLLNYASEIIDGASLLAKAIGSKDATVIIDRFLSSEVVDELGKAIVAYDLKDPVFVDTKKVNGWDYKVIQNIIKERPSQNVCDNGVVYIHANTCKMIADIIRKGIPVVSRNVVFTGDGLHKNVVLDVRNGTLLSEVIASLGGYVKDHGLNLHIGDYLTGIQVSSDDMAITESIDAIHISIHDEVEEEDVCIKCGECNDVCPVGILPQRIMDAEMRDIKKSVLSLHIDECIECGLCSFVCPSKINVLEWMRRAKRRIG